MAGPADYQLSDRYIRTEGTVLLSGVQALARIPIDQLRLDKAAGRNTAAFLSGYPGSPLGGFDLEVSRALALVPDLRIVHQPAVNEELGATSVMGSQLAATRPDVRYDGIVGIWYGKAPGLDRAGDALRHAVFAGSSRWGGAVALVGDDPAAKSSTMPSSSDATLVDLHMPVLYPGNPAECLELGLHGVAISRSSGLWSSLKVVTAVADGSGTVDLPVLSGDPVLPTVEVDGEVWQSQPSAQFLGPRMVEVEREFREIRLELAKEYGLVNKINRVTVDPAGAWLGILATGFTYYEVVESLGRLGLESERAIADAGIRLLQLRMPVPFDDNIVRSFAQGLEEIFVVEEKNPTLESLTKDALYSSSQRPRVVGKFDESGERLLPGWGRLDADSIGPGLRRRLEPRLSGRLIPPMPAPRELIPLAVNRTPFFCSGCPHNWGTKVPEGSLVGAGTGCHGMTLLMDPERVGEGIGVTAMGNEGAQWVGMAPFVDTDHLTQNYGDGTYLHSGQLAIQYCVGAGMHMTFKILYNSTVAMTGGQDSVMALAVPELATVLLAQGVTRVSITADDPGRYRGVELPAGVKVFDRTKIVEVQEQLRAEDGVTVLIHDQECAAELRRDRKRGLVDTPTQRIVINHRICEGCGDCGDVSNCLSVQPVDTFFGRKTAIDQASCNFDYSCLQGDCPAFMSVTVGDPTNEKVLPAAGHVPAPDITNPTDVVRIRMAGIGGTGVVTVAQILATAAMIDGWEVRGLDQTGLSQKAGPVVSDITLARGVGHSNLVGEGQADLLIAFDELVGAADQAIGAVGPGTIVVSSPQVTPTGAMISNLELSYPDDAHLRGRVGSRSDGQWLQPAAGDLTEALVGNRAAMNIFVLGVALQTGRLPIAVEAVERAIELNGVAVGANKSALTWGRRWTMEPGEVEKLAADAADVDPLAVVTVPPLPPELAAMVAALDYPKSRADTVGTISALAADLVDYQDIEYGRRFLEEVAKVRAAEGSLDGEFRVSLTMARSLHKLMAYKDEYEVARLMLLPEAQAAADAVGGVNAKFSWKLHPPILKALGLSNKISVASGAAPVVRALRSAKKLRGGRFDPFGRTELRRIERELPGEFCAAMAVVVSGLDPKSVDAALVIAELPTEIRGYEDLKMRRIISYREILSKAIKGFERI